MQETQQQILKHFGYHALVYLDALMFDTCRIWLGTTNTVETISSFLWATKEQEIVGDDDPEWITYTNAEASCTSIVDELYQLLSGHNLAPAKISLFESLSEVIHIWSGLLELDSSNDEEVETLRLAYDSYSMVNKHIKEVEEGDIIPLGAFMLRLTSIAVAANELASYVELHPTCAEHALEIIQSDRVIPEESLNPTYEEVFTIHLILQRVIREFVALVDSASNLVRDSEQRSLVPPGSYSELFESEDASESIERCRELVLIFDAVTFDGGRHLSGETGPSEDEVEGSGAAVNSPWNEIYDLALASYYGLRDTLEDDKEAMRLFKQAERLGSPDASSMLGDMYYFGFGCQKDLDQSLECYKRATQGGYRLAYGPMAYIYYKKNQKTNEITCWEKYFSCDALLLLNSSSATLDLKNRHSFIVYEYVLRRHPNLFHHAPPFLQDLISVLKQIKPVLLVYCDSNKKPNGTLVPAQVDIFMERLRELLST